MNFTDIQLTDRMKSTPVLVVDDAEFNRTIIIEILTTIGIKNIISVGSGKECLEALNNVTPGIIILDLMMPEMDGFECIQHIRKRPQLQDIPIIVQTAMGDADERLRAFHDGANDLLTKPINPFEMVSRFKLHLGYQHVLNDLRNYQRRVKEELSVAREMQMSMLPKEEQQDAMLNSHKLVISSVSKSSSEVGGDLWNFTPLSDTQVAVHIYDISGHGVAAAINAVRVNILLDPAKLSSMPPGDVLHELNLQLCDEFSPSEFATFFLGLIDLEKNTLQYAVSACTESLVLNRDTEEVLRLERAGVPLGVSKQAEYETYSVPFNPGDSLMLYSDALTETERTEDGSYLPIEDVEEMFKRHMRSRSAPPKQLQERAIYETMSRIGADEERPLDDDLTIALITRLSS